MKLSTPVFAATTLVGAGLLALSAPLAASAHVNVEPTSTAAGSYSLLTFSLSHGCDGSATTGISIDIPESIESVTPTVNPGWNIEKVTDGEGRVTRIAYTTDAPLADGLRTTFELSAQLPADAAGQTLAFPVLQTCEVGETDWSETLVAGEDEPAHPAPSVLVTAATAESGHGHGAPAADDHATDDHAADEAAEAPAAGGTDDVLARVFGIGGLMVGAIGLVVALASRRKTAA